MGTDLIPLFAITAASLIGFLKTAIGLGVVIFVHELGHFLVAKACGVKCEKFYIGFDAPISIGPWKLPTTLFKRQWGETEYGIGIIPLGGYVKMLGQDDNPANAQKEAERIRVPQQTEETQPVALHSPANDLSQGARPTQLDPRSYPAKPVWQRMAIISAGVIMNLIFAVIFATSAYYLGVKYLPCVVGSAQPGSPGWEAGLMPGDTIVQLGKDLPRSEYLRFDHDLSYQVARAGLKQPLDMLIRRVDGGEEWLQVQPRFLENGDKNDRPRVGISPGIKNRVLVDNAAGISAALAAGLKNNDEIIAIEIDGNRIEISSPNEVQALLAQYPHKEMVLTVRRHGEANLETAQPATEQPGEEVILTLPVQGTRSFGMAMTMGKIESIRHKSPAEKAGLKVNDIIVSFNAQPVRDPLRLEQDLLENLGNRVQLEVKRSTGNEESELITVTVTPEAPRMVSLISPGKPAVLETIGVAFTVEDIVASVEPESPAAKAGILPGDQVTAAKIVAKSGDLEAAEKLEGSVANDPGWEFTGTRNDWAGFSSWALQSAPEGIDVEVTLQRGTEVIKATLTPMVDATLANPHRGIRFAPLSRIRQADSLAMAVQLGFRETKEGVLQVVDILRNIGSLFKSVGGPIAIATIGTQEAQEGLPRLLIFLTMLSANLAVLNFLPIPVLDGGHMVFLAYEGIIGKPVNERVAISLTMVGMALLLGLMAFVIGKDILWLAGV